MSVIDKRQLPHTQWQAWLLPPLDFYISELKYILHMCIIANPKLVSQSCLMCCRWSTNSNGVNKQASTFKLPHGWPESLVIKLATIWLFVIYCVIIERYTSNSLPFKIYYILKWHIFLHIYKCGEAGFSEFQSQ